MSGTGAGYDQSVTTYSPDGKVYQVEFALKAIEKSGTAIGVKCKDGIVMGVEKLLTSKMLVEGSNRRVYSVDDHIGVAITGLQADGRVLVKRAADECRAWRQNFGEPISPRMLAERMANFYHLFTSYWSYRPYGATLMIAGYDIEAGEHELYHAVPTGDVARYFGVASGKGTRSAKTEIEKMDFATKTCREALGLVAKIMHTVHDDVKDKPFELELSWVCEGSSWQHQVVPKALRVEANDWAIAQIEEEDAMSSDEDDDSD